MEEKIAIVAVGYNRPKALARLLRSIGRAEYGCEDIPLIISIDHSGDEDVLKTAEEFPWEHGEKSVIHHSKRLGLREHILSCGDLTEQYEAVMVLEDDLYVSPDYYHYAMHALRQYGNQPEIAGISLNTKRTLLESAYPFFPLRRGDDVFFQQFATSWGQVWNRRMWKGFRGWYGQHPQLPELRDMLPEVLNYPETSWAKFYQAYLVDTGRFFVCSYDSMTTNFGDAGEHFNEQAGAVQSVLFYGKKDYRMPEFADGVKYDIYGEPLGLGAYLDVPDDELTCDFWGRKRESAYKRYLLTCRRLPYRAIKKYAMAMKPMELNVMENIQGQGLYLYDTSQKDEAAPGKAPEEKLRLLEYSYGTLDGRDLAKWALERLKRKLLRK